MKAISLTKRELAVLRGIIIAYKSRQFDFGNWQTSTTRMWNALKAIEQEWPTRSELDSLLERLTEDTTCPS